MSDLTVYPEYTEHRKADRLSAAKVIEALVAEYGWTCEREDGPYGGAGSGSLGERYKHCIQLKLQGPQRLAVTVEFDGRSCQHDVHVLSWHFAYDREDPDRTACLADVFGYDAVNQHHFAKATQIAYGFNELVAKLRDIFVKANDGSAFSEERKVTYLARVAARRAADAKLREPA